MIIIAEWKFMWLYFTLAVFYMGIDNMGKPFVSMVRGRGFDFGDAMAETVFGLVEIFIGAITTIYVLYI